MDTISSVVELLRKDVFMASVDIADAYNTVKVDETDQKYLKFFWNNVLYKLTAMPMGYSASPRIFTKILKPILAFLQRLGHTVVAYLDDIYIQAESIELCKKAVADTVSVFEKCGFLVNYGKSHLEPTQKIQYLGFELDSVTMTIKLTKEKELQYTEICKKFQRTKKVPYENWLG
jgi:hypothetical protein